VAYRVLWVAVGRLYYVGYGVLQGRVRLVHSGIQYRYGRTRAVEPSLVGFVGAHLSLGLRYGPLVICCGGVESRYRAPGGSKRVIVPRLDAYLGIELHLVHDIPAL
jgi:hypothetical protein